MTYPNPTTYPNPPQGRASPPSPPPGGVDTLEGDGGSALNSKH